MPVKILREILDNNRYKQVKIQFCSVGDGYYRHNEKYLGCVYVTPRTLEGELNHFKGRYYNDDRFKNHEFRSAFYKLVEMYNKDYYEKYGKLKIDPMFSSENLYRFR